MYLVFKHFLEESFLLDLTFGKLKLSYLSLK